MSGSPTSSASPSVSPSPCPWYRNGKDPNCPFRAKDFGISLGLLLAFLVGFCLLWVILCVGWLLCCGAWRQASKGFRHSRQKIEEVKRRRREKREKRQANMDVEKAAADKRDVTVKAEKLKEKDGMESAATPIEEDSRWARAKSWFDKMVWRPRMKMEKDVEQDAKEMKETQKEVRIDSDTEVDDPVVAVEEESKPGSQQL